MTRRFTGDQILIATHNSGKLEEMVQLFAPFNIKVVGAAEINLPVPEETENTFVGNARIKALAAVKASGPRRWQPLVSHGPSHPPAQVG